MFLRILKNIAKLIIIKAFDPPFSVATKAETSLGESLKQKIKVINNAESTHKIWSQFLKAICKDFIESEDPRYFMRWDSFSPLLSASDAHYLKYEFKYLRKFKNLKFSWSSAIKEDIKIRPPPYMYYPKSSGNSIHLTYHLAKLQEHTKLDVSEYDYIFEFGAGYGRMAQLFAKLGFKGRYYIFDFNILCHIQDYYLSLVSLKTNSKYRNIVWASNLEKVKKELSRSLGEDNNALFLSTWGMSETPLSLREAFFPYMKKFRTHLLSFQEMFGSIDNLKYFSSFAQTLHDRKCTLKQMNHYKGNYYLISHRQ